MKGGTTVWLSRGFCVQDIKFNVHAHPTLSEVLDELFKQAHLEKLDRPEPKPAAAKNVAQEARV